jgi:hypothetical protein
VRLRAAALASALLVACEGAPPANVKANDAAGNLTIINDAAADEEARLNSQPAEIPPPPLAGEARVDALLAALRDGDEAAAHRLVGEVGYIVATSGIVSSEDQFIARVLRCETEDIRTRNAPVRFSVVWNCPQRGSRRAALYNAAIATGPPFATADGPVTILEFAEGRTNSMLSGRHPPPPAALPSGSVQR